MQFKNIAAAAAIAASASAEYVVGDAWNTLTPTGTYSCGYSAYSSAFGIAVEPITTDSVAKRDAISQIGDGQIQAATTEAPATPVTTTLAPTSTEAATSTSASASTCPSAELVLKETSCKNDGTLTITLKDGVLTDGKGRIGSIVSNRQFQFDGPPPQAGAIYAGGWSITPEGNLAIGSQDVFYQCLSGNFYNLYDQSIAPQCSPIHLAVVDLVTC
ncbi:hypothetical protein TBLA_0C05880 [Henningerozyma blattae CBS 6284]|uniref:Cell wall mannoprotein PIR1-like C-terminal domain-containing protein n=1 Tax=Henningerozyma blattae (strain ATCC 34711 / CBS 6284 / DSM 70876 / NBRC 10599 / NRRL Y-10934 / UCD 77-7) TaxID=1071380 RepID=I2H1Y3_HENB6|nr:hypothetical protein TBLA_0C05880 [Tetrapisispora blattae CBS 6284]CCH60385.1 hypothetical protein TBLA_0C05880 [Tetrapisispora blattae CBS 6284]